MIPNPLQIEKFTVEVSTHVIQRRLEAEHATPEEIEWIVKYHWQLAADTIRAEFASIPAPLHADARKVFIHPGREARIGMPLSTAMREQRTGASGVRSFRSVGGEYYLYADYVCYVVDHNTIVTAYIPSDTQLTTIEALVGRSRDDVVPKSIVQAAKRLGGVQPQLPRPEAVPDSGEFVVESVPTPSQPRLPPPPAPIRNFIRPSPPTARWLMKDGACWTILVVDETGDGRALATQVRQWLGREFGKPLPEPILFDRPSSHVMNELAKRLSHVETMEVPEMPRIRWESITDELPKTATKWWERIQDAASAKGQFLTILYPETARLVLEIANGSSSSPWRFDPSFFTRGSVIRLARAPKTLSLAVRREAM